MTDVTAKALLMVPVAIEKLEASGGEPDIAKVRWRARNTRPW